MADPDLKRTVIQLDKGVWNKENARDVPDGALVYARNCEYRGLTKGLSRRRGSAWAMTSGSLSGIQTIEMLARYVKFVGSTDKIVVMGIDAAGTGIEVYAATTSGTSNMTFSLVEAIASTSVSNPTSLTYNDIFYYSRGTATPRAWNATTVRAAGITNPTPVIIPSVIAIAGTGITVSKAFHFTYRYKNSTDNVIGELINGNNLILSASYPAESGATIQGFEIVGLPTASPSTGVDEIQVFMSFDEDIPSAFYLMETLTIGDAPLLRPTANTVQTAGSMVTRDRADAYDGNPNSKATFIQDQRTTTATAGEVRYTTFATETRADWVVEVDYTYGVTGGTPGNSTIDYSTNSGGAWTNMVTLAATAAGFTTATATVVGSIASSAIQVRVVSNGFAASGTGKQTTIQVYDIRLTATAASGRLTIGRVPNGDEEFVNSGNFGHFQPPPARIFPYTFEGHLLGVSDTAGLWLAYSQTDRAEAWSTDPNLAAFPYLIPFKDKEVDTVVGAAPIRNQLIVFCTDSIWRINHLPVLSDPEANTEELFAEARTVLKQRITDSFGAVHEKAYTIIQMGNEQDVVFFWSRVGPAVTDGFNVWKVSDHYDWETLATTLVLQVVDVFNDALNSIVYVVFHIPNDSERFALTFYYGAQHIMEITPDAIRMKVLGPIYSAAATRGWGLMLQAGTSGWADGSTGTQRHIFVGDFSNPSATSVRIFRADEGTTDAGGALPVFTFGTQEYGEPGVESHFNHAILNVQETGSQTFEYGGAGTTLTPNVPMDKDPLEINAQGNSLMMIYGDGGTADLTAFKVRAEDGALIQAPATGETVSYTASTRTINSVALFHKPTRPVAD